MYNTMQYWKKASWRIFKKTVSREKILVNQIIILSYGHH